MQRWRGIQLSSTHYFKTFRAVPEFKKKIIKKANITKKDKICNTWNFFEKMIFIPAYSLMFKVCFKRIIKPLKLILTDLNLFAPRGARDRHQRTLLDCCWLLSWLYPKSCRCFSTPSLLSISMGMTDLVFFVSSVS